MKRQLSNRRQFLLQTGLALGGAALTAHGWAKLPNPNNSDCAFPSGPHRLIEIFLNGGWDSALATDPAIGSKSISNGYEAAYQGFEAKTVSGKSNLIVGHGLEPALAAFGAIPTAFINGLRVDVTAHELAQDFLLSGRSSLSRTTRYPSLTALVATDVGCFPPHVVLGDNVPLADTRLTHPPLHATDTGSFIDMLKGPRSGEEPLGDVLMQKTRALTGLLNQGWLQKQSAAGQERLTPWVSAESKLSKLYDQRFDQKIIIDASMAERYGFVETDEAMAALAGAFLTLKSGLCPYITINTDGYDTHSDHLASHVPLMRQFAVGLSALVADLKITPDPSNGQLTLADTTTIVITSEFVRTPKFNVAEGTDHWESASAIFMGKGVKDNVTVGATDDDAHALGWEDGKPVERTKQTELQPGMMVATALEIMGRPELTENIHKERIHEVLA
jgi:hypothetical protein